MHQVEHRVDLHARVQKAPTEPGCYLWKDAEGEVLYVGKAKNLRARMMQYLMDQDEREKIPLMMARVADFEYVVVNNEHESLILEKNLIQQYRPPFNVDFKDDKSYPFIAITCGDLFPAIKYTREKRRAGTRYFGPYTDSRAARETIDIVRRIVPICSAQCNEWKRVKRRFESNPEDARIAQALLAESGKPCFDYHVGKGPGVCVGAISSEEYAAQVKRVTRFLSGHRTEFIRELESEMSKAAASLDFERAARVRDRLATIQTLQDSQQVVFSKPINIDALGFFREETIAGAHVLVVREGRVIISNEFVLTKGLDVPMSELVEGFMKRYYSEATDLPDEVEVPIELPDADLLSDWLSDIRGRRVQIHRPQRGEKKRLLELADRNAKHTLMRFKVRTRYDDERRNLALLELESALALPAPPMRIECFDVSTIHGRHSVASMVVFRNGRPDTSQYRRFRIRMETEEANDFAMMHEVLGRRYAPERMADERFGSRPDLLIVDGGKPQLNAALSQLKALDLDIPVAGLAKADEELFVPWSPEGPIVLPSGSASLYLVKQIRDEAHRFAITYHREIRAKAMTASVLDDIEGVGPKRKRILLRHFGSVKKMRAATIDEIIAVKGIPAQVAEDVFSVLQQAEPETEHGAGEEQ